MKERERESKREREEILTCHQLPFPYFQSLTTDNSVEGFIDRPLNKKFPNIPSCVAKRYMNAPNIILERNETERKTLTCCNHHSKRGGAE